MLIKFVDAGLHPIPMIVAERGIRAACGLIATLGSRDQGHLDPSLVHRLGHIHVSGNDTHRTRPAGARYRNAIGRGRQAVRCGIGRLRAGEYGLRFGRDHVVDEIEIAGGVTTTR